MNYKLSCLVLALVFVISPAIANPVCYGKVEVTGRYMPELVNYDLKGKTMLKVMGKRRMYNASFIAEVQVKTSGLTARGERLVYGDGHWYAQSESLESKGWYPVEKDYFTERSVTTAENEILTFPKAFVDAVESQRVGKIANDQYLIHAPDGTWHLKVDVRNHMGGRIEIGNVHTNLKFFNLFSAFSVTIFPQPSGMENISFRVVDYDDRIADEKVSIFSGTGLDGLRTAVELTGTYRVCFEP